MKIELSGLKPMNEDEKVPCGIDGLMIDMGESKEFVMELWEKYDSFFDSHHIKKKEEIVRCKDCYCFGEPTYIKGYHVCSFYKTHIQENDYCSKGIKFVNAYK